MGGFAQPPRRPRLREVMHFSLGSAWVEMFLGACCSKWPEVSAEGGLEFRCTGFIGFAIEAPVAGKTLDIADPFGVELELGKVGGDVADLIQSRPQLICRDEFKILSC